MLLSHTALMWSVPQMLQECLKTELFYVPIWVTADTKENMKEDLAWMKQHFGCSCLEENSPLDRVKRTKVFRILLTTWLAIISLTILPCLLSTLIYLNYSTCHVWALTACTVTGGDHLLKLDGIMAFYSSNGPIHINTDTVKAFKFIWAFAECHSKTPKNLSITQLFFHKAAVSIPRLSPNISKVCDPRSSCWKLGTRTKCQCLLLPLRLVGCDYRLWPFLFVIYLPVVSPSHIQNWTSTFSVL